MNAKPKPEISINLSSKSPSALHVVAALSNIRKERCYHARQNLREPLGIYNVSTLRICTKVKKCAEKLEQYISQATSLDDLHKNVDLRREIIDYLELCIYAAAEHVDDVDLIAKGFFEHPQEYKKSRAVRKLKESIKPLRGRISSFANAIKHNQSRIRIFSIEFVHNGIASCLNGFFVEAVSNGVVMPSPVLHSKDQRIFSITSFLWEILVFLALTSEAIEVFLNEIGVVNGGDPVTGHTPYAEAVIAVARLPLYSFDDVHPFQNTRVIIGGDPDQIELLRSGIYGSIANRWLKSGVVSFGQSRLEFEGDGSSCSFEAASPKALSLQHWD